MNNLSDKNVLILLLVTIAIVFSLIFSIKSPERKIIESPIMWKEEFSSISIFNNKALDFNKII